jgi:hypothetical protein
VTSVTALPGIAMQVEAEDYRFGKPHRELNLVKGLNVAGLMPDMGLVG